MSARCTYSRTIAVQLHARHDEKSSFRRANGRYVKMRRRELAWLTSRNSAEPQPQPQPGYVSNEAIDPCGFMIRGM